MRFLEWWKNYPQRDNGRALLRAEVDVNLGILGEWWGKIKPRKSEDEIHWVDKVVYARELADAPVPDFSRDAYMRYQPSFALYLRGDQIERLEQFYNDLREIEGIQRGLRGALEKDRALRRSLEGQPSSAREASPTFDEFLSIAARSWFQAAHMISTILFRGNPL